MAQSTIHTNEIFHGQNYSRQSLRGGEFDGCSFVGCDFSYADISGCVFSDCVFEDSRIVMTVVVDTVLRRAVFRKSDLRGVDFETASEFGFEIGGEESRFDNCSFVRRKMRGTPFRGGELRECYFAECDLSDAVFDNCVMTGTTFERCDFSGADLRTAIGYVIDPVGNRLAKARFSELNLAGLVSSLGVVVE